MLHGDRSWPLVGDAVNLDFAIHHHAASDRGSRGRVLSEIFAEDFIESAKVARIVKPNSAADDVFGAVTGFFEDGDDVLDGSMRLGCDVPTNNFPFNNRNLAGNVQPSISFCCSSKWEP